MAAWGFGLRYNKVLATKPARLGTQQLSITNGYRRLWLCVDKVEVGAHSEYKMMLCGGFSACPYIPERKINKNDGHLLPAISIPMCRQTYHQLIKKNSSINMRLIRAMGPEVQHSETWWWHPTRSLPHKASKGWFTIFHGISLHEIDHEKISLKLCRGFSVANFGGKWSWCNQLMPCRWFCDGIWDKDKQTLSPKGYRPDCIFKKSK